MTNTTVNLRAVSGGQRAAGLYAFGTGKSVGPGTDFGQMLENATGRGNVESSEDTAPMKKPVRDADVRDAGSPKRKEAMQGVTKKPVREASDISQEDLEDAMEVLETAVVEIQQLLCDTLDISPQELSQALDELGMMETELLSAGKVTELALYLEGETELSLLTDESLYQTVQDLEGSMKQLAEDVLQQISEIMPEDPELLLEDAMQEIKDHADRQPGTAEDVQLQETAADAATKAVGNVVEGNKSEEEKGEASHAEQQNLTAGTQTIRNEYSVEAPELQKSYSSQEAANTQAIADQILDYLEVSLKPEETTLHMQLHPEDLGNVHIMLSAKEGVMTAQFSVESESVRAALENQVVQLQEKFDQQNIKVEAIEITVATHEFEQNLHQGSEENAYEQEEKKPRIRKIDISGLSDADAELPEDDRVVAEMMQLQGNSIDYTV